MNIQGHRGARGLFPENTIRGFIEAVKIGVATLELDVVISKDLKVVVSHEPWMNPDICSLPDGSPLTDTVKENHNLYEMNYDEIKLYDCGKRGHPRFPEQQKIPAYKPLLADMIDAVEKFVSDNNLPKIYYNIETKSTQQGDNIFHPTPGIFAQLLYDVLIEKNVNQRSFVQSFDLRTLQYLHDKKADVKLILLIDNHDGFENNLERLGFMPDVYSPMQQLVDEQLVHDCKNKNMQLIPWTVNDSEQMLYLKNLGVDGLITDFPDVARQTLRVEKNPQG
ncbi:MAG: glycerophosphodiester phosphodiesterase family protein [Bacteroidia bacterium]